MNLKNQRPVFVPAAHWAEFDELSKAALMDIVWDYATRIIGSSQPHHVIEEFRAERDVILMHRKNAKAA